MPNDPAGDVTGGLVEAVKSTPQKEALGKTTAQCHFDAGFSAAVVLLFLIYPSTWKQILVVFSCFTLDAIDYGPDGSQLLPALVVMQVRSQ